MKDARGLIISVALTVVVAGGAAWAAMSLIPMRGADAATAMQADAALKAQPGLAKLYDVIEARYPDTYGTLMQRSSGALARRDYGAALATASKVLERPMREDMKHLDHADPRALAELMKQTLALMTALRGQSAEACVRFDFNNMGGYADPAVLDAASRWTAAAVEAAHGGRENPRTYPRPTRADMELMGRTVLQHGLTVQEAMEWRRAGGAMNAARKCDLAIKVFRALLATPEPARSRIVASIGVSAAMTLN